MIKIELKTIRRSSLFKIKRDKKITCYGFNYKPQWQAVLMEHAGVGEMLYKGSPKDVKESMKIDVMPMHMDQWIDFSTMSSTVMTIDKAWKILMKELNNPKLIIIGKA